MIIQDNLGLTKEGHLIIPRGQKDLSPISLDLGLMFDAESRLPDIQRSTAITLPELITVFLLALNRLSNAIAIIELEYRSAKTALKEYRAIALLEKVDDILSAKGIKSSADTREAAVDLDPDVRAAQERFDVLTALQLFLSNKNDVMQSAYDGAKKIADMYLKTPYSPERGG